jgi:hypothetical protein
MAIDLSRGTVSHGDTVDAFDALMRLLVGVIFHSPPWLALPRRFPPWIDEPRRVRSWHVTCNRDLG